MVGRSLVRCTAALALLAAVALAAATSSQAAVVLPGYYSIQAKQPFPTAPHLFVGAVSSSTIEPVRLMSGNIADPIQRQRVQWQIIEDATYFRGSRRTAYIFVNRYTRGCMTDRRGGPGGNGTPITQAVRCFGSAWLLNNGSGWVRFSDPHGQQVGFQFNLPIIGGPQAGTVYCVDVTALRYVAGNHLQMWRCTGNWNQRFIIRRAA